MHFLTICFCCDVFILNTILDSEKRRLRSVLILEDRLLRQGDQKAQSFFFSH